MTGVKDSPAYLSRLTIGAFMDLGYDVNVDAADPFTLDQLSKTQCAAYCPEATGAFSIEEVVETSSGVANLEGNVTTVDGETGDRNAILSTAAALLQESRVNAPQSLPEGYEYVGGDSITLLTEGPDGRIKGTMVTWDEVQAFLTSDTPIVL